MSTSKVVFVVREMKTFGIISDNIHCNLADYGLTAMGRLLGWMIERMRGNARRRIGG